MRGWSPVWQEVKVILSSRASQENLTGSQRIAEPHQAPGPLSTEGPMARDTGILQGGLGHGDSEGRPGMLKGGQSSAEAEFWHWVGRILFPTQRGLIVTFDKRK